MNHKVLPKYFHKIDLSIWELANQTKMCFRHLHTVPNIEYGCGNAFGTCFSGCLPRSPSYLCWRLLSLIHYLLLPFFLPCTLPDVFISFFPPNIIHTNHLCVYQTYYGFGKIETHTHTQWELLKFEYLALLLSVRV